MTLVMPILGKCSEEKGTSVRCLQSVARLKYLGDEFQARQVSRTLVIIIELDFLHVFVNPGLQVDLAGILRRGLGS